VFPYRLSHQTLADLVSARRPSVTHALGDLRDDGRLMRISPGRWLLRGPPPGEHARAEDERRLAIG
jgi:predicted transcriptional regulator of viral defense system